MASTRTPVNVSAIRLPRNVIPSHYSLTLQVDYDPFSSQAETNSARSLGYTGTVIISFRAKESTDQIVMHMDRNVILTSNIDIMNMANSQTVGVTSSAYGNYQFYLINLATSLVANTDYVMTMQFRARTTTDGFYYHGYEETFDREFVISLFFFINFLVITAFCFRLNAIRFYLFNRRSVLGTRFSPNLARTAL